MGVLLELGDEDACVEEAAAELIEGEGFVGGVDPVVLVAEACEQGLGTGNFGQASDNGDGGSFPAMHEFLSGFDGCQGAFDIGQER